MKKTVICALVTGILLLTGCGKASNNSADNKASKTDSITNVQNDPNNKANASGNNAGNQQSNNASSIIKNAPAGKTPKLSSSEKARINSKVVNAMNSIDKALNSVSDSKDINLNGM